MNKKKWKQVSECEKERYPEEVEEKVWSKLETGDPDVDLQDLTSLQEYFGDVW